VRDRALLGIERALRGARAQQPLALGVAAIEDRAGAHERRCRDDEPDRADEADPFLVGEDFGIDSGHQFVSGHR